MDFPLLFDAIRDLSRRDYRRIGLSGNPAYSELHRGRHPNVHIPREPLESEIKTLLDSFMAGESPPHVYMFSRHGGAGKSHTTRIMQKYCEEKGMPFIYLNEEDAEECNMDAIRYAMHLAGTERLVAFRECDSPRGFYARLLEIDGIYVIGHGHEPDKELGEAWDKFRIFDLDEEYRFSNEQIRQLLSETLRKLTIHPVIEIKDEWLDQMSEGTEGPGESLSILGTCLAICAYKAKTGREPRLTEEDFRHARWLNRQFESGPHGDDYS